MAYVKRYDAEKLARLLDEEGWELAHGWKYGEDYFMLCMLRRKR